MLILLTVKGNQHHTFAVPASLKPGCLDAFDEHHGRLTRRRVFAHPAPTELTVLEDWPGIKSILAVESIRMVKPHGAVTAEKRYFICRMLPLKTSGRSPRSVNTGRLKTVCIGCWMSRFKRMLPASETSMLDTISPCCEKSLAI